MSNQTPHHTYLSLEIKFAFKWKDNLCSTSFWPVLKVIAHVLCVYMCKLKSMIANQEEGGSVCHDDHHGGQGEDSGFSDEFCHSQRAPWSRWMNQYTRCSLVPWDPTWVVSYMLYIVEQDNSWLSDQDIKHPGNRNTVTEEQVVEFKKGGITSVLFTLATVSEQPSNRLSRQLRQTKGFLSPEGTSSSNSEGQGHIHRKFFFSCSLTVWCCELMKTRTEDWEKLREKHRYALTLQLSACSTEYQLCVMSQGARRHRSSASRWLAMVVTNEVMAPPLEPP